MQLVQQAVHPFETFDVDAALRTLVLGTATETGERFFTALVENLAQAMGTLGAWVTEYYPAERRLHALALLVDGEWVEGFEYDIDGTPCEEVVDQGRFVHYPDNIMQAFPDSPRLRDYGAVSFIGVPLIDTDGSVMGHISILDRRPMPEDPRALALLRVFSARAAAELQRLRRERMLREREANLRRLFDGAMDALIELDELFRVTQVNPAAAKLLSCAAPQLVGTDFRDLLSPNSRAKFETLVRELDDLPGGDRSLWIPGGFAVTPPRSEAFEAEATLSRNERDGRTYHTLVLRNVNERLEAERKIAALTQQSDYLREELGEALLVGEIVGHSTALRRVLRDVQRVAGTDSTVLILGETGTGKELVARAIHDNSRRAGQPLIKVNCAAIPAALIESELFGHERGAFTGATQKRQGRFSLADKGTIFLDEVGELPLELQPKLLRVLQEGEFEAVGGTRTHKVDVRVLAATNRDLAAEVRKGAFREDLFYRLNVFPLTLPPLRERREDIGPLAETFARRFAAQMGRELEPLSPAAVQQLEAYDWPGNVRELQNVIERAIITAEGRRINLAGSLPQTAAPNTAPTPGPGDGPPESILTAEQLQALERANIVRALEAAEWRVSGPRGAAALLGLNPSTLSSRLRTLGIRRSA